jgi:serine/threonine protein kinase/tetratricopeptide (TPR) repeat protein
VNKHAATVKDVFDRAHEIPAGAERQAYLDQACASNAELRQEVESLLRALDKAGSFLEKPTLPPDPAPAPAEGGTASTVPPRPGNTPAESALASKAETGPYLPADSDAEAEGPGTRIGPYRLVAELGHGGMGAVYLAEQEYPVRRRVALKLIKAGMDSDQIIARFEAERQALALMDHLNIARVLDAGATEDRLPYFVMELVQGVPITRFCDENHLTVRERLELFVPVCQAIQHAHQKGIIHRDIKPSNVLVTRHEGQPFPKVIDFGIAKAIERPLTDQTPETLVGTVVGTPEYMSPEQANLGAGGVDTRSDVYSLGVMLYELLTGTTPIGRDRVRGTPLVELLCLIAEEEPPRPSARVSLPGKRQAAVADRRKTEPAKLARLLRGDLDWIAMRALEKDRNRRYETASGLARDVQRYLADEPVEACPPSTGYRLRKFARKHRTLVGVAAGFVVMLLLGLAGLGYGLMREGWALEEKSKALVQARAALEATEPVIRALAQKGGKLSPFEQDTLRTLLQDYRRLASVPGNGPDARVVEAERQFRMAYLAAVVGEPGEAEDGYRRAIQLCDGLTAEFPEVAAYRTLLARSHFNLGLLLDQPARRAEAEAAFRRAIELHEQLVADSPGNPGPRSDLAAALNDLAVVLREQHQPAPAEAACRRAIDIGNQVVADFPDHPDHRAYRSSLGAGYANLGNLVRDQGQFADALTWYGKAIELLAPLEAQGHGASARFLRNAHWDRANALGQLGRHTQAVADWQRALDLDGGSDQTLLQLFRDTAREEEQLQANPPGAGDAAAGRRFYAAARRFGSAAEAAAAKGEENQSLSYARRAMEVLRQAQTAGFFRDAEGIEELKKDPYLKALRRRPDFQKFVAGLDAGKGPK